MSAEAKVGRGDRNMDTTTKLIFDCTERKSFEHTFLKELSYSCGVPPGLMIIDEVKERRNSGASLQMHIDYADKKHECSQNKFPTPQRFLSSHLLV